MLYGILCNPGHNRVYFHESKKLSISELAMAFKTLSVHAYDAELTDIAGILYVTFSADEPLAAVDIQILSSLSFTYAMYQIQKNGDQLYLSPIQKTAVAFVGESMGTILKYTGKTNELFTQMMINAARFASQYANEPEIKLLDPVAGKGTTLFEGLIRGYHVYGIEMSDKVVNEAFHFAKRYLETEKYKHSSKTEKVSGEKKSFTATRYTLSVAKSKEEAKEKNFRTWEMMSGNSEYASRFYKKNSFHLIVGDLPYGVQHGNITREKQSSLTRNPAELLQAVLPGWREVLMPGGAMALAWNTFVLPKEQMQTILLQNQFTVVEADAYDFTHRVDQAIRRDIVIAVKDL